MANGLLFYKDTKNFSKKQIAVNFVYSKKANG